MDGTELTPVDLIEEIRGAIDASEPRLLGRAVDIEMARVRVLAQPGELRRELGELIGSAAARTDAAASVTVSVARTGKSARVEVRAGRGDGDAADTVVGTITLALAPGSSTSADA